ncbi:integrin alpha-9-like isoform X2 [Saccostrea cucullata]|uniref:integrin alpha-9-like isoform X2 n=1 Tax=Saccostrea cuccullata TaxID=36930 RepID=UPI002ED5258A
MYGAPKSIDIAKNLTTGTLYYCTPNFVSLADCRQLSSGQLPGVSLEDGFTEERSEMWLGASVDAGVQVTFCGPRWRRSGPDGNVTAMNGLCYEVPLGYLQGDPSGLLNPSILIGLYNSKPSDQFTEAEGTMFNQTIKYGVSASGLSIKYMRKDGDIWIGSPGLNEFSGGAVHVSGSSYTLKSENTTETKEGQLYGYAVSVGKFYSDQKPYIAIGGPRDGGSGKVIIMDSNNNIKEKLIGSEPGSYFGSVLCVIPGNGGGSDYLLVGAPMYSEMQTYSTYYHSIEEMGRVYVYRQTNETLQMTQILEGSKCRWCRFGFAMANLNDINNDGFNDVVIGAPFENDGQGAVFVYMGYKRGFYLTQTITAASVAPSGTTLSTFGSSFTQHPADFNSDQYADLSIGAYGSDMALILFTNPPITMKVGTKTNLTKTSVIALNTTGFTLNVCFDYDGANLPSDVLVTYEITADQTFLASSISKLGRVCFKQSDESCVSKVNGTFTVFKAPPDLACPVDPLQIMVRDDWENMRGLFVPVDFEVEFNVSTTGNTQCTVSCPVVNKFDPNNDEPFAKSRKYSYQLAREGCVDEICESDVKLMVTSPDTLVTGPQSEYSIDVSISNQGEPSYNTEILFTFHPNMTLYSIEDQSDEDSLICSSTVGSIKCSFNKQRFDPGEQLAFRVLFNSSELLPVVDTFDLKVEVQSDSTDKNLQDNTFNKTVRILTKVMAIYNVAANPDTYITKVNPPNPTIEVNHSIQIVNTGPSNLLDTMTFNLEYAHSSLVKARRILLNVSSATNYTLIQCQNQVLVPEGETDLNYRAFIMSLKETGNCERGAVCNRLTCEVGAFMYNSFILVVVYYDVAQNLYDTINSQTGNDNVQIVTKFTPEVKKPGVSLEIQRNGGNSLYLSTSVKTRFLPSKKEPILPTWGIVLIIIGSSLLILGVVCFILYKRGFFVRKYKNEIKAHRLKNDEHAFANLANESTAEEKPEVEGHVYHNFELEESIPTERRSYVAEEPQAINRNSIDLSGLKQLEADMDDFESHLYVNPDPQMNSTSRCSSISEESNRTDNLSLNAGVSRRGVSEYAAIDKLNGNSTNGDISGESQLHEITKM